MKKRIKMLLAIALSISLFAGSLPALAQVWDGYTGEEAGIETIVDMNSLTLIEATDGIPSTKVRRSASYTLRWREQTSVKNIRFNDIPRDWSRYGTIFVPIYSSVATNQRINMIFYCDLEPNTTGATSSHFTKAITVDWTGWRVFELSTESDFNCVNSADWAKVKYLQFNAVNPVSLTELYFDSITAERLLDEESKDQTSAISYSAGDIDKFKKAIDGAAAIYNFTKNAYVNGEVKAIGEDVLNTTVKNGLVMAPVELWSDILGAQISGEGDTRTITLNGKMLSLKAGEINESLGAAPYIKDETFYTPVVPIAKALGKEAQTFGLLTVIGEDANIEAFKKSRQLEKVGGYVLSASTLSVESIKDEDFIEVRKNWRKFLLGDENNNLENENVKTLISSIEKSGKAAYNSMNTASDAKVLFGTKEVETSDDMTVQYEMMWSMAKAYGTYGSSLYKDESIKSAIFYALEWLWENYYGEDEIGNNGWRDVLAHNWWDWYVGTPTALLNTLMVMEEEMLQDDINRYIAPFDYIRSIMKTTKDFWGAQTRSYVVTLSSVLKEDRELLMECLVDLDRLLTPQESQYGVMKDWTYLDHKYYPMDGMYGTGILVDRYMEVATILAGTKFEVGSSQKYNQALWVYNTFMPLLHNGVMFFRPCGRSPDFGLQYGRSSIKGALATLGCFSEDDDLAIKMLIKQNVADEKTTAAISGFLKSIYFTNRLVEVMNDDTLPEAEEYERAMMRYKGDIAAWQKNGISAFVSMSSERIGIHESINYNNMEGWHQGDGGLYIYTDKTDGLNDEFGSMFWEHANMYRLPGTTEDTRERAVASLKGAYLPQRDFVGGVELDGEYIAAAMDFEAYHHETVDDIVDTGSGGANPVHFSDLVAKKSYFMFDDEVVAVGSDINSTNDAEVNTYIDNRTLSEKLLTNPNATANSNKYAIVNATAVGDDGNAPMNVTDGSYDTRWSFQSSNDAWLMLELEEAAPIGYVGIAQYGGTNGKQAKFDLQLSVDGNNWETVYSGMSSGTTDLLEAFSCGGKTAKYVKYVGAGRTNSAWNSITEFEIYAPRPDGQMVLEGATQEGVIYGAEDIIVDGVLLQKEAELNKKFSNPSWVHLEAFGGYYLPDGGSVVINKENKQQAYFEMWLEHGMKPQKGTYSYVMLPKKSAEETAQYSKNPDVEILVCNDKIHVVREKKLGITSMVFWEAGTYGDITVSMPMIVMVKETDGEYKIAVSDPTQKEHTGYIVINRDLTLKECDEEIAEGLGTYGTQIVNNVNNSLLSVESQKNSETLTLDFTKTQGATITATFGK